MIFIDSHVHVYSCFDLKIFFESAHKNFQTAARQIIGDENFSAVILLTDWVGRNWFQTISEYIDYSEKERRAKLADWEWKYTKEDNSFCCEDEKGNKIYVIAGKKIVSSEKLEILTCTTDNRTFADGLPLVETVETILSNHSIPIIPWAVGKWVGGRGRSVDELIDQVDPERYFFCDNSNRPWFWPTPKHFIQAEKKGGRLLSGSDPLHFPSEQGRVGSFGCWVDSTLDSDYPSQTFTSILTDPAKKIHLYGTLETPLRFFRNQTAMQLFKKKWKSEYYKQ